MDEHVGEEDDAQISDAALIGVLTLIAAQAPHRLCFGRLRGRSSQSRVARSLARRNGGQRVRAASRRCAERYPKSGL